MNKQKILNLIKKIIEGDKNAFDTFYDLTKRSVYYVVFKIIPDKNIVEDIMQDTYVVFLNNLKNLDFKNNVGSYLLTIAKNKTIDYVRKNSKIECVDDIDEFAEPTLNVVEKLDSPLIKYCYENLTKYEFKILEMTVFMGYKRVEVAKLLDMPISTINWQYNHILKKIKKFYKEVYDENN